MATVNRRQQRSNPWPVPGAAMMATMVLAATLATSPASAHTRASDEYRVKPGDSLSLIARSHDVSLNLLAAENGISNVHLIRVGQVLRIPRSYYQVEPGDTLSQIAARFGVSVNRVMVLNGLDDANRIRSGQRLRVPAAAGPSARAGNPATGYGRLPSRLRANPDRLQLIPSFEKWAAHYGVPADVLMAVAYRESGWQTSVISSKGAIGVGQLLPRTAEWLATDLIRVPGLDPYNPDDNIRMSARFLAWLIGYMGSLDAALAGYYQGPGSVAARGYYDDTRSYIANINQIRVLFRHS